MLQQRGRDTAAGVRRQHAHVGHRGMTHPRTTGQGHGAGGGIGGGGQLALDEDAERAPRLQQLSDHTALVLVERRKTDHRGAEDVARLDQLVLGGQHPDVMAHPSIIPGPACSPVA